MAMVQVVRGPVGADELGVTLMHEHVFILTADVTANYGHEWWDEDVPHFFHYRGPGTMLGGPERRGRDARAARWPYRWRARGRAT